MVGQVDKALALSL